MIVDSKCIILYLYKNGKPHPFIDVEIDADSHLYGGTTDKFGCAYFFLPNELSEGVLRIGDKREQLSIPNKRNIVIERNYE